RTPGSMASSSAPGGVMDPGRRQRLALQLVGQLDRTARRTARRRLSLGRGGQAQDQPPPQLVVVALVRLDGVAVERGRLPVPHPLAELDELLFLNDGDRLARELTGGDALDGIRQGVEIGEEGAVAAGQRVDGGGVD